MKRIIVAMLVATAAPAAAQQSDWYSFRSANFPSHYIRHANYLAGIAQITDEQARDDATWRLRPGLTGSCYTFESVNFPQHYLRHQNFRVTLQRHDGTDQFRADATFCPAVGLTGQGVSWMASNFSEYFLRHRNFELWLERADGSQQFRDDATFFRVEPVRF